MKKLHLVCNSHIDPVWQWDWNEGLSATISTFYQAAKFCDEYDYIFIDCPPSLGLLTINALTASNNLIIPIQGEYYALEGLSQLMATVRQIKRLYNPTIDMEGVLLTMYDGRLNLTQQVVHEIKKFFPQKLFKTVIPRSVRLSEAPSYGKPIEYYDRRSKGAEAYRELAKELIKQNKGWK